MTRPELHKDAYGRISEKTNECFECYGKGVVFGETCITCGGKGFICDDDVHGCQRCGEEDISPNIEAFEISGEVVCDECADEVFQENSHSAWAHREEEARNMTRNSQLQELQDTLTKELYPDAKEGHCLRCKQPFSDKNVHTEAGWKETKLSGYCEDCFDEMFDDDEEDFGVCLSEEEPAF